MYNLYLLSKNKSIEFCKFSVTCVFKGVWKWEIWKRIFNSLLTNVMILKIIIINFLKILWDCFYDYQQAVKIMLWLYLVLSSDMFNKCGWNEMWMNVGY